MLAYFIYTQFFATDDVRLFLGVWNIDKLFHIAGGIVLALFLEWVFPRRILPYLILLVAAAASAWEVLEYILLPNVAYFAHHSPELWRLDTIGDIVAAFLGAYGYWVFLRTPARSADSPAQILQSKT